MPHFNRLRFHLQAHLSLHANGAIPLHSETSHPGPGKLRNLEAKIIIYFFFLFFLSLLNLVWLKFP